MSTGRRYGALTALLAMAACARPMERPQPLTFNAGPPMQMDGFAAPAMVPRPLPMRLTPMLLPPQRIVPEPSYSPEPSYMPEPEPPFSDGTPFSLDAEPALKDVPFTPRVAETPPPPVRAATPAPAVPMVGFRPMRSPGGRSY